MQCHNSRKYIDWRRCQKSAFESKYCKIGSNTIVLKPVPAEATAVGNPTRIIEKQSSNQFQGKPQDRLAALESHFRQKTRVTDIAANHLPQVETSKDLNADFVNQKLITTKPMVQEVKVSKPECACKVPCCGH